MPSRVGFQFSKQIQTLLPSSSQKSSKPRRICSPLSPTNFHLPLLDRRTLLHRFPSPSTTANQGLDVDAIYPSLSPRQRDWRSLIDFHHPLLRIPLTPARLQIAEQVAATVAALSPLHCFAGAHPRTKPQRRSEQDSISNRSSVSEFGDDNFAVGSWEHKEVVSRDGHMKLQTQVFFASTDQRSEQT